MIAATANRNGVSGVISLGLGIEQRIAQLEYQSLVGTDTMPLIFVGTCGLRYPLFGVLALVCAPI